MTDALKEHRCGPDFCAGSSAVHAYLLLLLFTATTKYDFQFWFCPVCVTGL